MEGNGRGLGGTGCTSVTKEDGNSFWKLEDAYNNDREMGHNL